jgi:hypothetical protein
MKADKIYFSHFEFLTLESLKIDQQVGKHATAVCTGCIRDTDIEEYKWKLMEQKWVTITTEDDAGTKRILMTGIIAGFSLESNPHTTQLTLILKSGTYLMDSSLHFRSFQNSENSYLDVLNTVNQVYGESGVKEAGGLSATAIDFLLQYKETDWEFILRIASRFGLSVTPAIEKKGAFYYIGNANNTTYQLPESICFDISKQIDCFMDKKSNGIGSPMEHDYLEYHISSREIYGLWDKLILGKASGFIYKIQSEYSHGELNHSYFIRSENGLEVMEQFNNKIAGCSFQASVKEVERDMVKIQLTDDENSGQKMNKWFPYSTGYSSPDGSGWYCMPEPGDYVRLQIPGEAEKQGYVISSVHIKTNNGRKNPDHKSFKTKYGKELLFTSDSIEMTNNKGMSIKIKDGEGIRIESNRNISITSGGNMTISSEDSSLVIAGSDRVNIKQGGAGLYIDKDITFKGGKFRIQ